MGSTLKKIFGTVADDEFYRGRQRQKIEAPYEESINRVRREGIEQHTAVKKRAVQIQMEFIRKIERRRQGLVNSLSLGGEAESQMLTAAKERRLRKKGEDTENQKQAKKLLKKIRASLADAYE